MRETLLKEMFKQSEDDPDMQAALKEAYEEKYGSPGSEEE